MSTILKALDRLEKEKAAENRERPLREEVAEPHPLSPPRRRVGRTLWIGAGAAAASMAVGALFIYSGAPIRAPIGAPDELPGELLLSPLPVASAPQPGFFPGERRSAQSDHPPKASGLAEESAPVARASEKPRDKPPQPRVAERRELPPAALASDVAVVEPATRGAPLSVAAQETSREAPVPLRRETFSPEAREPEDEPPPAVSSAPPPALRDVRVARTIWHPTPGRRHADVEVSGQAGSLRIREGDLVGRLSVKKIEPWGVVFLDDGVEIQHRVGAGD